MRSIKASPNTRVQRTRSSASPPHSPLTRSPLGGGMLGLAFGRDAPVVAPVLIEEELNG